MVGTLTEDEEVAGLGHCKSKVPRFSAPVGAPFCDPWACFCASVGAPCCDPGACFCAQVGSFLSAPSGVLFCDPRACFCAPIELKTKLKT